MSKLRKTTFNILPRHKKKWSNFSYDAGSLLVEVTDDHADNNGHGDEGKRGDDASEGDDERRGVVAHPVP